MDAQIAARIRELLPKMTEKERTAFYLAFGAHTSPDQRDQTGLEYIGHPLTVYANCSTEEERVVALLHDVVEEAKITLDDLRLLFDETIVEAVGLLSHPKRGYDREKYLADIRANPIARRVKIEDLRANIDESRIESLIRWHADKVRNVYLPNLASLLGE